MRILELFRNQRCQCLQIAPCRALWVSTALLCCSRASTLCNGIDEMKLSNFTTFWTCSAASGSAWLHMITHYSPQHPGTSFPKWKSSHDAAGRLPGPHSKGLESFGMEFKGYLPPIGPRRLEVMLLAFLGHITKIFYTMVHEDENYRNAICISLSYRKWAVTKTARIIVKLWTVLVALPV